MLEDTNQMMVFELLKRAVGIGETDRETMRHKRKIFMKRAVAR